MWKLIPNSAWVLMQVSVLLIIMPWCFLSIPYSHHPCSNWVLCLAPTLMESKQLRIIPDSPYYFACNLSWDFSTYYPRSFLNYHSTSSFQWNCQILSLSFPSSSLWCIFLLVSQWFYLLLFLCSSKSHHSPNKLSSTKAWFYTFLFKIL